MPEPFTAAAWTPTMEEYHRADGVSASFISTMEEEGYSSAAANGNERGLQTSAPLVMGEVLHCMLQKLPVDHIWHSPPRVTSRRGKAWREQKEMAVQSGAKGILLNSDLETLAESFVSLSRQDTPAKLAVRSIVAGESLQRWPEVSHRWKVFDDPPLWCKVRPDFVVRFTAGPREGQLFQVPVKSTKTSLVPKSWWPFWRRYYLTSAAMHWAGMRDLFGEDVPQMWLVARLGGTYPWAVVNLTDPDAGRDFFYGGRSAQELIESEWGRLMDGPLRELHRIKAEGLTYGPEEDF